MHLSQRIVTAAWAAVVLTTLSACDTGSRARVTPVDDGCSVSISRESDGFTVRMFLACDEGRDCFEVTSLECQGVAKNTAVPVDLTSGEGGCPGASWCVESCEDGLETPGAVWDMPLLRETDGCNVYEDAI